MRFRFVSIPGGGDGGGGWDLLTVASAIETAGDRQKPAQGEES